jgi:hypothetical protein
MLGPLIVDQKFKGRGIGKELVNQSIKLVNDKKLEGISDIRDESDRNGMRIVFELKRDAISNVVLNKLYKFTSLQTSFSVNNICLINGRPQLVNLKDLISNFIDFRHEVIIRRTKFDLRKAEDREHIVKGLLIALKNIDAVIETIKKSKEDALENLMYLATHINHPSAVWCRQSVENYNWLVDHFFALMREYTNRYKKIHACYGELSYQLQSPPHKLKEWSWTEMPSAMDEQYIISKDPLTNYRNYYRLGKVKLHKWTNRQPPEWIYG